MRSLYLFYKNIIFKGLLLFIIDKIIPRFNSNNISLES